MLRRIVMLLSALTLLGQRAYGGSEGERLFQPHPADPTNVLLNYQGFVLVGNASGDPDLPGQIRVFDSGARQQLRVLSLRHSIAHVTVGDDGLLYVIGQRNEHSQFVGGVVAVSYLSVLVVQNGQLNHYRTTKLQQSRTFDGIAVAKGVVFLSDISDRSIYTYTPRTGLRLFASGILHGTHLAVHGQYLDVLEEGSFYTGDENFIRINLKDRKVRRILAQRTELSHLRYVTSGDQLQAIVFTQTLTGTAGIMQFDDPNSLTPSRVATTSIPGRPRGFDLVGRCMVVVSSESKTLHFVDLGGAEPSLFESWDISGLDADLAIPRNVAVGNAKSGRIVIQAVEPRVIDPGNGNVVIAVSNPDSQALSTCARASAVRPTPAQQRDTSGSSVAED